MTAVDHLTIESESYWKALSDEWGKSGLSQPEFCKRKNIKYRQFVVWRSKILKVAGTSRNQLQPVKINPTVFPPTQPQAIQIHLPNGIRLQISNGTDPATLSTILTTLGYLPC